MSNQRAIEWITGYDTGKSSKNIWSVMMGQVPEEHNIPYDADDFGRCYRLLERIPEWKPRMKEMEVIPLWCPFVREWDKLTEMYESEQRKEMYDVMCPLVDEGRLLDGWVRVGKNGWRKETTGR